MRGEKGKKHFDTQTKGKEHPYSVATVVVVVVVVVVVLLNTDARKYLLQFEHPLIDTCDKESRGNQLASRQKLQRKTIMLSELSAHNLGLSINASVIIGNKCGR